MSWGDLIADDRFWPTKAYSPMRRWLRQERARVHLAAVAAGDYTEPPRPGTFYLGWGVVDPFPLPVLVDPFETGGPVYLGIDLAAPRFEELAPWQDVTEGDETVFATPGKMEPFTIENPRAVVYPERIAAAQRRASPPQELFGSPARVHIHGHWEECFPACPGRR